MLLSREVLPNFALLSVSISFLMLFKFCGKGFFGNIHCVGVMGCYTIISRFIQINIQDSYLDS
jgi:hypothetical protein